MASIIDMLSDYTFKTVALGSMLLGALSGAMGAFAVLRKQSLLGDGISHAALPGIVVAFLITGNKNTEVLLLGALISGLLATFLITKTVKLSYTKFDGALALVMSVFFGAGMALLTYSQRIPNANQAGLKRFLYGQASAMLERDVVIMIIVGALLILLLALFFKECKVISFDPQFAQTIGIRTRAYDALLFMMIVLSIIVGLQTVGVVLMSAMLTAPAVAARQWTNRLGVTVVLAAVFGALSGAIGTFVSASATGIPTGPVIVIAISCIAILSMLFAPERGIIAKSYRHHTSRRRLQGREL